MSSGPRASRPTCPAGIGGGCVMPALVAAVLGIAGVAVLRTLRTRGAGRRLRGRGRATSCSPTAPRTRRSSASRQRWRSRPEHRGALMGKAIALLQSRPDGGGRGCVQPRHRPAGAGARRRRCHRPRRACRRLCQPRHPARPRGALCRRRWPTTAGRWPSMPRRSRARACSTSVLYGNARPSTVRSVPPIWSASWRCRRRERLLRVPDLDARQRMYKP